MDLNNLNDKRVIMPDDKGIRYMGRIDFSNQQSPKIIYAGSTITMRFKGSFIGAVIHNHKYYNIMELGFLIDGKEEKIRFSENDKDIVLTLAENLDSNLEHEIILFKRQDATHYFDFKGFVVDTSSEILSLPPVNNRRIECFGDSVSAGAVCEATDKVGEQDPENTEGIYDNAWHSYSMITARNLGAQLHNNAQGGIAIFDGTGYYHAPNHIGMESAWDKLCYFPEGGITEWDFTKYTPNVVIFAVGQNDSHKEGEPDNDIYDSEYRLKWKTKYKEIIGGLRSHYKNATFILMTTLLMHDVEWDNAIEEITNELNDEKIHHFIFKRNGAATPGHPRVQEQCEMAEELTSYISNLGDKIWR